jgi:hypothetical protein
LFAILLVVTVESPRKFGGSKPIKRRDAYAIECRIAYWRRERREISVTLSQLTELGEQAVAAIASSLARGGPVVRGQLIASRFYEAVQRELKQSPIHDPKGAALIAASDRCERIAVANIDPSVLVDELRQAIAVLKTDEDLSEPRPITQRPVLRLIEGGLSKT